MSEVMDDGSIVLSKEERESVYAILEIQAEMMETMNEMMKLKDQFEAHWNRIGKVVKSSSVGSVG